MSANAALKLGNIYEIENDTIRAIPLLTTFALIWILTNIVTALEVRQNKD